MKGVLSALIVIAACLLVSQSGPVFAGEAIGLWCAPEEPELGINADGVSFVDHDCTGRGKPFRLGVLSPLHCDGDSGGYDTELLVTLSGDTLTIVEDGNTTTYTRCPQSKSP